MKRIILQSSEESLGPDTEGAMTDKVFALDRSALTQSLLASWHQFLVENPRRTSFIIGFG